MKFRMLKIIFGVSLLSFVMAFGVCAPSAFAMEVTGEAADAVPGDSTKEVTGAPEDAVIADITDMRFERVAHTHTGMRSHVTYGYNHGTFGRQEEYGTYTYTDYTTYTKATVNGREYVSDHGRAGLVIKAVKAGDLEAVKAFVVKFGFDEYGSDALLWASLLHNVPVIHWLVEHGANVNANGMGGIAPILDGVRRPLFPPLFHAGYYEDLELMQYLLDHGADVNFRLFCFTPGYTPLKDAIKYDKQQAAAFLRAHGAEEPTSCCCIM